MTSSTTPVVGSTHASRARRGTDRDGRAQHEADRPEPEGHEREEACQGREASQHACSPPVSHPRCTGASAGCQGRPDCLPGADRMLRTPAARPLTKSKTSRLQVSMRS